MAIDFQEKLGPLPVWGWGIVGAAVVFVGYQFISRGGSGTATSGSSNIDGSGYQTAGIQGGSASVADPLPETNQAWLSRVSRLVAGAKSASPSEVYSALYKYVTAQAISSKDQEYVDAAISMGGAPPEGTQGVSTITPDAPTGFVREVLSGKIFALFRNGTRKWLSPGELQSYGPVDIRQVSADGDLIKGYEREQRGAIYAIDQSGDRAYLNPEQWAQVSASGYKQL